MTPEDKRLIAEYMNSPMWQYSDRYGLHYYDYDGVRERTLDLNDAGECKDVMIKKGDSFSFYDFAIDKYCRLKKTHSSQYFAIWLLNKDNFWSAFVEWRKSL